MFQEALKISLIRKPGGVSVYYKARLTCCKQMTNISFITVYHAHVYHVCIWRSENNLQDPLQLELLLAVSCLI